MPQRITPYLYYQDAEAALEWLERAFGFRTVEKTTGGAGGIHAELDVGDGARVYLGGPARSPREVGFATASVYVYVDDVDAAFERARELGGEVLEEPNEQPYGDRRAGIADLEGHHWYLASPPQS